MAVNRQLVTATSLNSTDILCGKFGRLTTIATKHEEKEFQKIRKSTLTLSPIPKYFAQKPFQFNLKTKYLLAKKQIYQNMFQTIIYTKRFLTKIFNLEFFNWPQAHKLVLLNKFTAELTLIA